MKKNTIFVTLYFAVLALCAGLTFFLPAKTFSPNENRVLAQSPELTANTLLSGEFQSDLDSFLSDQVPLRDWWIQNNTAIKKLLGKTEINGVYLGKDGYYFQKFTDDSYSSAKRNVVFALMGEFVQAQSVPVTVMPVPTPSVILEDKLPANAPQYDADGTWNALNLAVGDEHFIDLRKAFDQSSSQLYYRTDHHWTAQGAYLAYVNYCKARSMDPKSMEEFELKTVSDQFYGTIYSKVLDSAAKPDTIEAASKLPSLQVKYDGKDVPGIYHEEKLAEKDKYAYFFGGNPGKVELKTDVNNGKRLLIIKDSFANSMVPYLLSEYEEVVMIDLRYFNGQVSQIMEESEITEVLFLYEMTNLLTDNGIAKLR